MGEEIQTIVDETTLEELNDNEDCVIENVVGAENGN